jgi:hypothetical protein
VKFTELTLRCETDRDVADSEEAKKGVNAIDTPSPRGKANLFLEK